MAQDEDQIGIGELAARAGISASAIRYYERRGLLPAADRVGGRRRYVPEPAHRRLEVITVAKRAGLYLEEIRELLDAVEQGEPGGRRLRAIASRRLGELDRLLARAAAMRRWLAAAETCSCRTLESCPLFASDGAYGDGSALSSSISSSILRW